MLAVAVGLVQIAMQAQSHDHQIELPYVTRT